MKVNFTGIRQPKVMIANSPDYPRFDELGDLSRNVLRLQCRLTDDKKGSDLYEFQRTMTKCYPYFWDFLGVTDKDTITIDLAKSQEARNFGYEIEVNDRYINQWDTSIFGVCTFLCALCKKFQKLYHPESAGGKCIATALKAFHEIGVEALEHVH